jgi:DNA-binding transcriptional MerR regulator
MEQGFSGPKVSNIVGITYRQLDYWATKGIVTPSIANAKGSGSRRRYSFQDLVELRVIKKLLDAGISLPKIRKAIDFVRDELRLPLSDVTLVSDGTTIHACLTGEQVLDALSGGQAVFAVAVGRVAEEMQGEVAHLRTAEAAEASNEASDEETAPSGTGTEGAKG